MVSHCQPPHEHHTAVRLYLLNTAMAMAMAMPTRVTTKKKAPSSMLTAMAMRNCSPLGAASREKPNRPFLGIDLPMITYSSSCRNRNDDRSCCGRWCWCWW